MKVFGVETKVRFRNSGKGLVSFQSEMIMPGEEKDISLLLLDNPSKVARNYELGAELVGLVVGGKLVKICDCEDSCGKSNCELGQCVDCPVEKAPDSPVEAVEEKVEVPAPVVEEKAPDAAPAVVEKVVETSKPQAKRGK